MVIVTQMESPVPGSASAVTLRLGNELIDEFKRCLAQGQRPKLVVKGGYMVSIHPIIMTGANPIAGGRVEGSMTK